MRRSPHLPRPANLSSSGSSAAHGENSSAAKPELSARLSDIVRRSPNDDSVPRSCAARVRAWAATEAGIGPESGRADGFGDQRPSVRRVERLPLSSQDAHFASADRAPPKARKARPRRRRRSTTARFPAAATASRWPAAGVSQPKTQRTARATGVRPGFGARSRVPDRNRDAPPEGLQLT
jgi:hypothetical protein